MYDFEYNFVTNDEQKLFRTVERWIKEDGSTIDYVVTIEEGTFVHMIGPDGCKEVLACFHNQEV